MLYVIFIKLSFVYCDLLGKHQEDWLHAEDSLKEGIHFYVKVSLCSTPRGGGTPLYGLYRYVPRNRVWFLEVLDP